MKRLRVGMIGYGCRGEGIVQTLRAMPERYEVGAICDSRAPRRAAAEAQAPAVHDDFRPLLADESLEAVFIATPQDSHCALTVEALAAGKHVFCEKPMALSLGECDRMIAAAGRANRLLMIGQQMRYSAHLQKLASLLRQGTIGRPSMIFVREFRNPFPATMLWAFDPARSGGTLVEKSCHHFDVFNWLADSRPVRVFASGGALVHREIFGIPSGVADHAVVTVEYESGCKACYLLCMFAGAPHESEYGLGYHHREIGVLGTAGMLRTEGFDLGRERIEQRFADSGDKVVYELSPHGQVLTPYNQNGNIGVFWEFHEAIAQGRGVFTDGAVGRSALALSLAAERSLALGQPVDVPA